VSAVPAEVDDRPPGWGYEAMRVLTGLYALTAYRAQGFGSEHVPNGPVVLALSRGSGRGIDAWLAATFIRRHVELLVESDEDLADALAVLQRRGAVSVRIDDGAPGGAEDTHRTLAGQLALASGAPVVPVALAGAERIRAAFSFPKVVVRYGEPLAFEQVADPTPGQELAVAGEIARRIGALTSRDRRVARRRLPI
jgi:1-acyl-sn-glycerol-3-phosphate acyltransferase